ncbi:MAG: hypothetical protein IFK92_11085 [Acidobacteria bacterium]|nr:hypothetical protein [Candidatus Sulfomarinibacter kjeldsenii]
MLKSRLQHALPILPQVRILGVVRWHRPPVEIANRGRQIVVALCPHLTDGAAHQANRGTGEDLLEGVEDLHPDIAFASRHGCPLSLCLLAWYPGRCRAASDRIWVGR